MSHHPCRVLHVGPIPPPTDGGIAAYLDGLLQSPLSRSHQLLTFDVTVPTRAQRIRPLRAWTSAQFLSGFARALHRQRPDVVHIHSSAYLSFWEKCAMGRLAALHGLPWVLHLHDGGFERFLRQLRQPLAGLARNHLRSPAAVVTVCQAWRDWLVDWVEPERLVHLPNAISVQTFSVDDDAGDPLRLAFMGDLSPAKGLWDLLQALGRLHRRGLRFQLDVLGPCRSTRLHVELQRLLETLDLTRHVVLHGLCLGAEKQRLLARADLFVLPSHSESFCIANLEGMASGLPVVSTRTGAIPEVVRHGREGLLVEPHDVDGLTESLERLLCDDDERQRMARAARRRAEDYDWRLVSADLAGLYDRIVEQRLPELLAAQLP